MEIYYAKSSEDALRKMTDKLIKIMQSKPSLVPFNLALSGGCTARRIFALWQEEYKQQIDWNRIRFYWVDERCVSPEDDETIRNTSDAYLPYFWRKRPVYGGKSLFGTYKSATP